MSSETPTLKVSGNVPARSTAGAVGMDLRADVDGSVFLAPGMRALVTTGTRVEIPEGYAGWVTPRSGLAVKHGITVLNAPGLIDSDYRGDVGVILVNLGDKPYWVQNGDRIAQLSIAPAPRLAIDVSRENELSETERGERGFGSTGK